MTSLQKNQTNINEECFTVFMLDFLNAMGEVRNVT